jgi:hypothetical protein
MGSVQRLQQFGNSCDGGSPHDPTGATVLVAIGAVAYLGGMVYDIVDAAPSAERYNASRSPPAAIATTHGLIPSAGLSGLLVSSGRSLPARLKQRPYARPFVPTNASCR